MGSCTHTTCLCLPRPATLLLRNPSEALQAPLPGACVLIPCLTVFVIPETQEANFSHKGWKMETVVSRVPDLPGILCPLSWEEGTQFPSLRAHSSSALDGWTLWSESILLLDIQESEASVELWISCIIPYIWHIRTSYYVYTHQGMASQAGAGRKGWECRCSRISRGRGCSSCSTCWPGFGLHLRRANPSHLEGLGCSAQASPGT